MKLTVLGNTGPFPRPAGCCSGYLIEHKDNKVLIDCGNGVMSNLLSVTKLMHIDAIILTHLHPDHISDIFIIRYSLVAKGLQIPLYASDSPIEDFNRLKYKSAYSITKINDDLSIRIGEMKITFREMKHSIKNFGVCIELNNKKFVYSGDTMYTDNLIEFAKNADLLLIEAGVLEKDLVNNPSHLSGKQACIIGNIAFAKRLLLTHFYPEYSIENYRKEVSEHFKGILEFASIMKTYFI